MMFCYTPADDTNAEIKRLREENKRLREQLETISKNTGNMLDNINESCRYCSNHPSNGGSGICNCIIGLPQYT